MLLNGTKLGIGLGLNGCIITYIIYIIKDIRLFSFGFGLGFCL
jgi:hypothetical protein